jgi:hypothetical protein
MNIICKECGIEFIQGCKGSVNNKCPKCQKKYNSQYYQNHKLRIQEQVKVYQKNNKKEVFLMIHKQFYDNNIVCCRHCGKTDIDILTIDHINGGGKQHSEVIGRGSHFYQWLKKEKTIENYQILCMNCQRIKVIENKECYIKNPTDERLKLRPVVAKCYQKLKIMVIAHYSNNTNQCKICGCNDIRCLQIDHVNNDGVTHRKILKSHMFQHLKTLNFPNNPPLQVLCANCNLKKKIVNSK